MDEDWRPDFEQAVGESFGERLAPPVPIEDASPHECCEVLWQILGRSFTAADLDAANDATVDEIGLGFARYFECDAPSREQIQSAIGDVLSRWPPRDPLR